MITGLGGAGKTDVVVRASVSDIDPKDIWVSGPTDAQVLGLQEVIKEAIIKELENFRVKFKDFCEKEGITLPIVKIEEIKSNDDHR